jgi:hypothetical protein
LDKGYFFPLQKQPREAICDMMKTTVRGLLVTFVLFAPALMPAQGNRVVVVVPDGRMESDSIPVNSGSTYLFSVLPGHSYSIEQSRGLNSPIIPMWIAPSCPSPYGISVTDTSTMDPAVNINIGFGQQRQREAFACPGPVNPNGPPGQSSITIYNNSGTTYTFNLSVTDTTLLSGKWRAGMSADTFWTFTNTSSAPINIFISLADSNGFPVFLPGPTGTTIAPGATYSADTTQIPQYLRNTPPTGAPLSGSILVGQNGPPGAVLATAVLVTNSGATPSNETVKFEPRP